MLGKLFRQKSTRGPLLGIIVATVFIAIAASLLVSLREQNGDAEAGQDVISVPNVVDQVAERDIFNKIVEGQTIQINASSQNERMRIVVAAPPTAVPSPVEIVVADDTAAKPEVQLTSTPAPAPQNPDVIQVDPTLTVQFNSNPQVIPPTFTPIPVVVNPNVSADLNNIIARVNHTVSAGETIFSLATRYNSSVTMMSEAGISEVDMFPGNVIVIPYANNAACSSQRAYPIKEGDTLFRIGVNNGTTAVILQQINGIDANYSIDAGSAICLP
ncbi:MAG: LysM peptidoglycan-binding domain-containing protein [Anaerolineae bacterium]